MTLADIIKAVLSIVTDPVAVADVAKIASDATARASFAQTYADVNALLAEVAKLSKPAG